MVLVKELPFIKSKKNLKTLTGKRSDCPHTGRATGEIAIENLGVKDKMKILGPLPSNKICLVFENKDPNKNLIPKINKVMKSFGL